jgi:hypothetical protein
MKDKRMDRPLTADFWSFGQPYDNTKSGKKQKKSYFVEWTVALAIVVAIGLTIYLIVS